MEILKVITPDDGRTSRAPANEEKASMRCPLRDLARPLEPGEPDPLVDARREMRSLRGFSDAILKSSK